MRIAFAVLKYFPFGGLERDMLRMAESAAERGHRVVIHTSKWEDDAPLPENIEVRLFPLKNIANHRRMQEFEQKFEQAVKESVFDVKVAFNRIGGCDFYFAADNCYAVEMPKKHSKWVLSLLPRYRAFLLQERKVFSPESSTRVFYITPHQKEDFIRSYGTQEERFLYLPPGINGKCVRPANADEIRAAKRRELGVAEEERMLLQVASNYKLKGGDRSIEALSSLPESLRKRCRLFFAGVPDSGRVSGTGTAPGTSGCFSRRAQRCAGAAACGGPAGASRAERGDGDGSCRSDCRRTSADFLRCMRVPEFR